MTDEAEISMLFYAELSPSEENRLKSIDKDVSQLLHDKGINARAIWSSKLVTGGRSIQLCIAGDVQPKILHEFSKDELKELSPGNIVLQLQNSL